MFQIKATVIGFLGDEEKYPCHFKHKIGDEFIYDGEKFIGRVCPNMAPVLIPRMMELHASGPRFVPPFYYYYPFWYVAGSVKDPSLKKYDGLGFRNVLETREEPQYHVANMMPEGSWVWPPVSERSVAKDWAAGPIAKNIAVCGDLRTLAAMKIEALDLSDKGYDVPYFRRQMVILDRVSKKQGIQANKILDEFSKEEREVIYPTLGEVVVEILVEELALMGYLEIKNGQASVTSKGQKKVEDFKAGLSAEEREALKL